MSKTDSLPLLLLNITLLLALSVVSNLTHSQNTNNENIVQAENNTTAHTRLQTLINAVFNEPYQTLPSYKVNRNLFGPKGDRPENQLLTAAKRTFNDDSDLITFPTEQKLLNANGICFIGTWRITEPNTYTGLYQQGVTSPIVVRASVALSGTEQKDKRAFGMAVKLLPNDLEDQPSLNIFVLHSIGGTKTKHTLDLSMDNQPPLGRLPRFRDLSTALRLKKDLESADKSQGAAKGRVSFRPVDFLANYKTPLADVRSPKWLRLNPSTKTRIDENDFRNELRTDNYPNKEIRYEIEVAPTNKSNKTSLAIWQVIGEIVLTDSVTSKNCDTRLHFKHPKIN